jgi:hypothetical protein
MVLNLSNEQIARELGIDPDTPEDAGERALLVPAIDAALDRLPLAPASGQRTNLFPPMEAPGDAIELGLVVVAPPAPMVGSGR